jgi:hypothetical protein
MNSQTANGVAASSTVITSVVSTELREIEIFILLFAVQLNVDANIAGQGRPTILKQPSAWSMPCCGARTRSVGMLAVSKHHSVGNSMYRTDKVLTILAARQCSVRLA